MWTCISTFNKRLGLDLSGSRIPAPEQGRLDVLCVVATSLHIPAALTDLYIFIALSFGAEEFIAIYRHNCLMIAH
ncbi:MAG: hypothetical protein H7843_15615 [Nitrospirota bacterium]